MSLNATTATWAIIPELRARVVELPEKRRPSGDRIVTVALLLADRHRDDRGYVDETVPQIAATLALTDNAVRTALAALHDLGYWHRDSAGNRHSAARRRPTFLPVQRGADPTPYNPDRAVDNDLQRGADPTLFDTGSAVDNVLERGVEPPRAWVNGTYSVGSVPPLPYSPDIPSSSSARTAPTAAVDDRADDDDDDEQATIGFGASSAVTKPASTDPDDPDDRAVAACVIIGDADFSRARTLGKIRGNPTGYRKACRANAIEIWRSTAVDLADEYPTWPPAEIATYIQHGELAAATPDRVGPGPPREPTLTETTTVIDLADNGAPIIDLDAHRARTATTGAP